MYKVTVIYKHPLDPAAFEKYYIETHMPIAAKIPHVDHVELTVFSPSPMGEPDFYRMAELYFTTEELMILALSSPEGKAAVDDIPVFATGGVHFLSGKI